ncbi:30S ribosomal protein S7 [Candidatus Kuenenbacteria bacterium]|nr:30S ribosomal protein S7 [Candidatus Kuenenbacteria bacterium]
MRGKQAPKRKINPDTRYNSTLLAKFINYLMIDGKKSIARKVVYDAFDEIQKQIDAGKIDKKNFPTALNVFDQAVKNVVPQMEVRGRRIGGGNYQIPYPVRGERRTFLSLHWIINAANNKKGKPMAKKLSEELMAALNNDGDAVKKRMDVHRMAESNRAFAHFARY